MTREDLRYARLIEAKRRWIEDETPRREVEHLADLYETCWTPPPPVSDDLLAAREWHGARWPGEKESAAAGKQDGCFTLEAYLAGCTRGREGAKGLVPKEAVSLLRRTFHQTRLTSDVSVDANALGDVLDYFAALASAKRGGTTP